ncbi:MAG TPA: membrane dipeptidase [Ramlibacter sp.]|nr:membrane dipeptidase [Ramlibacter sp.]
MAATAPLWPTCARAQQRVPIADMHSHFGMISRRMADSGFAQELRTHGVALVAWKMIPDGHFLTRTPTGVEPKAVPAPGELAAAFQSQLRSVRRYMEASKLAPVLTRADVDRCTQGGEAGIVIASEGADFLEGKVEGLDGAHAAGLRHLQLVHYIPTPVGDRQTGQPAHGGLSAFGRSVVEACNAKGILVDLAHCSAEAVDHALQAAQRPVVWSHGWVDRGGGRWNDRTGLLQRRLSVEHARKIAQRGGVVGLWASGLGNPAPDWLRGRGGWTVGRGDVASYAKELLHLADVLGSEHVAIGSDIEGLGASWAVNDYAGVRQVIDQLAELKAPASTIERLAYANDARVLRESLAA